MYYGLKLLELLKFHSGGGFGKKNIQKFPEFNRVEHLEGVSIENRVMCRGRVGFRGMVDFRDWLGLGVGLGFGVGLVLRVRLGLGVR